MLQRLGPSAAHPCALVTHAALSLEIGWFLRLSRSLQLTQVASLNGIIAGLRGDKSRLEAEVGRLRTEAGADKSSKEQAEAAFAAEKAER